MRIAHTSLLTLASAVLLATCSDPAGPDGGFTLAGTWHGTVFDYFPPDRVVELRLSGADSVFVGLARWTGGGLPAEEELAVARYHAPQTIELFLGPGTMCNWYAGSRGAPIPDSTATDRFMLILAPGTQCQRPLGLRFER
jgi:hypothetical protein